MKKFSVSLTLSALTLALALILGLVMVGCATSTGGGGEQFTDPVAAEQLAAEFNAIREGTATVNGATVTLGRIFFQILPNGNLGFDDPRFRGFDDPSHPNAAFEGTWIKTRDIIVPAGVTLDISADDSRLLLGTMTFTVNGTVITRSGGVGLEDNAGEVTINGNGTIYLKGKGSLFGTIQSNRNVDRQKLILDGVTLVGVDDNNEPLINVGNGGELVLKSGAITGNNNAKDDGWWPGGGVNVGEQGTFTMSGGTISGNSASGTGGGVGVQGTFTMSGGTISGNRDIGVALFEGTFTMSGGVISGNSGTGVNSGGVWLNNSSSFTLEGGTIYGSSEGTNANTAPSNSALGLREGRANTAKWGTGGTYTRGGVPQTGGSDIPNTDETLIAIPAR